MAPPYPPPQFSEFPTEMYPNVEENPIHFARDYFENDPRNMVPPYPLPQTSEFLTEAYPNVDENPLMLSQRDCFGNDPRSMAPTYPPPQFSEYSTRVAYPNVEENSHRFLRRDYFENGLHPREDRSPLHEDNSSKFGFPPSRTLSKSEKIIGRPPKEDDEERICRWKACGKQFTEQDEFIDHVEAHIKEDGKIWKCLWEGCSRRKNPFNKKYLFLAHIRRHFGRRPYACVEPECQKAFFHSVDMVIHRIQIHGKKIENPTQQPEEPKQVKDATEFPRKDHLENDQQLIPREEECRQEITVELGGKVYSVISEPPRKTIAPPQEKPKESEPVKDVTYSPRENRKRPLPEDPSSKPEFVPGPRLSEYGVRIGYPPKLRRPVPDDVSEEMEDDEERICRWKTCGKQFTEQDEFVSHVYAHMNEDEKCLFKKSYWERCRKVFRNCQWEGCRRVEPFDASYKLKSHVRSHVGHKPYVCNEPGCNNSYARLENLKVHRRVHTGEKPFECSICQKKFTNNGDKARHEKSVHGGKKQYQCGVETCGKRYTDPSTLRRHFCTHHPELFKEFKAGKHRIYIGREEAEQ